MKRREALKIGAGIIAGGAIWYLARNFFPQIKNRKSFFLTSKSDSNSGMLNIRDIDSFETYSVEIPTIGPHGYAQNPARPDEVLVIGKFTEIVSAVSLSKRMLIGSFRAEAGETQYGHGCFSLDGNRIFTVESKQTADVAQKTFITVRNAATYAKEGSFPTYGFNAHDLLLHPDGKSLFVTNNKISAESGKSFLAQIQLQDGKLHSSWESPGKEKIGHISFQGERIFASTTRVDYHSPKVNGEHQPLPAPPLVFSSSGAKAFAFSETKDKWQLTGFSVAASQDGAHLAVTYGPGFSLGIFRCHDLSLAKRIPFEESPSFVSAYGASGFLMGDAKGQVWQVRGPDFSPHFAFQTCPSQHSFLAVV